MSVDLALKGIAQFRGHFDEELSSLYHEARIMNKMTGDQHEKEPEFVVFGVTHLTVHEALLAETAAQMQASIIVLAPACTDKNIEAFLHIFTNRVEDHAGQ